MEEELMEIIPVCSVVTHTTVLSPAHAIDLKKVLYILVTPYFVTAWKDALATANLTHSFPNLVHDISHGSPIGNPPPLLHTFIPNNLSLANIRPDIIWDELREETTACHMSGPFTTEEARVIFDRHFRASPVGLVEKVPGDGKWRMIRHLSKTDCEGFSMNLSLDSHDFPTTYYSMADVAAWVSTESFSLVSGSRTHIRWSEGARVLRMKDARPSAGRMCVLVPVGRVSCCS